MLTEELGQYILKATEEVAREFLGEEWKSTKREIEKKILEIVGKNYDITDPETFDRLSYCQYKVIAEHVGGASKMNLFFTVEVGKRIYEMAKRNYDVEPVTDPDDILALKRLLEEIGRFFQDMGYVSKCGIRWDIFDEDLWKEKGEAKFIYKMVDPVILPSAQQLFKEDGFAQHFSSRTIEHALKLSGIEGREVKDFDPTEYSMEDVEELWELRKITSEKY